MPQKSAAALDEEQFLAGEIAKAVYFTAHVRVSPTQKFTERRETYEAACARRDELVAEHSRHGRGGMVYAVTPRGDSIPCTDSLVELSRSL
jgi:hypothetical protein